MHLQSLWLAAGLAPVAFLLSPSYIHPDELFQSQEVLLASGIAGDGDRYANIPWEFADALHPSRSIVPPALVVGLPLRVFSYFAPGRLDLEPFAARAGMVALLATFAVPGIASLAQQEGLNPRTALALFATSWVGSVMMGRPFSNSSESIVLFALLCAYLWFRRTVLLKEHAARSVLLRTVQAAAFGALIGGLAAFGIFVRFTFAAFALPLVLMAAWECFHALTCHNRPTASASPSGDASARLSGWQLVAFAATALIGAAIVTAFIIAVDSVFFGGCSDLGEAFHALGTALSTSLSGKGLGDASFSKLRIAPWNNFLYNLDPANLALHGLHPRWLHLAVNGHIMYGSLWLPALLAAVAIGVVGPIRSWATKNKSASSPSFLLRWSSYTLLFSLFVVSTAPHQEARFLAPLIWPVVFLGCHIIDSVVPAVADATGLSKSLGYLSPKRIAWALWLAFNALLAIVFGVLHQAHIPASAAAIGRAFRSPSKLAEEAPSSALLQALRSVSQHSNAGAEWHMHYIGTYMVPHTAAGVFSSVLVEAAAAGTEGQHVSAAPWAAILNASETVRSSGGMLSATGDSNMGARRLFFHEHSSFESPHLRDAIMGRLEPGTQHLFVYPSTIANRGHTTPAFALASCRLEELHRELRFLSTEDAPSSLEGWLSALLLFPPLDAAFEAVVGREPDIPSLVFSRLVCG